jgi:hypothetical protein
MGDIAPDFPAIYTGISLIAIIFLVLFRQWTKTESAGYTIAADKDLQLEEARGQIARLREEKAAAYTLADRQRSEKHKAINDLTATRGTLHLVRLQSESCTCGALGPVQHLLNQVDKELP